MILSKFLTYEWNWTIIVYFSFISTFEWRDSIVLNRNEIIVFFSNLKFLSGFQFLDYIFPVCVKLLFIFAFSDLSYKISLLISSMIITLSFFDDFLIWISQVFKMDLMTWHILKLIANISVRDCEIYLRLHHQEYP